MSTLRQLVNRVLANSYDPGVYQDIAAGAINDGARELARRTVWGRIEVEATVNPDGTVAFASPVSWSRIISVVSSSGRLPFAGDRGAVGQTDGSCYRVDVGPAGTEIRVFGVSGTVRVVGYRLPAKMVELDQQSELGDDADAALVVYGKSRCSWHEDDFEEEAAHLAGFEREVKRFSRVTRPVVDGPLQVVGMWPDG